MAIRKAMKTWRTGMLLLILFPAISLAQIRWWGIYDFEVLKGGKDSREDLNSVLNNYLQLNAHQFQLFAEADVSDDITLITCLANSPQESPNFKGVDIQLAYVTVSDLVGDALSVSLGKIVTPFGLFAKRQLAPDNPFIGYPLFFTYPQNVSPQTGYLDPGEVKSAGDQYGGRLNTIYTGAYFVGAEAFGSFVGNLFQYDIALMNAPLSSTSSDYNVNATPSIQGRVALHPAIWGTIGFSLATGPFMTPSSVNQSLQQSGGSLDDYRQTTYGVDLTLSYLYYELNAEYIFNRFKSPYIVYGETYTYTSGLPAGEWLNMDSREFLADLRIDAPFYPGLFLALRYNPLRFGNITDPYIYSRTRGKRIPWNSNVTRYAVGLGYKPAHSVLIKLDYQKTDIDVSPRPNLDVAGLAVVISF